VQASASLVGVLHPGLGAGALVAQVPHPPAPGGGQQARLSGGIGRGGVGDGLGLGPRQGPLGQGGIGGGQGPQATGGLQDGPGPSGGGARGPGHPIRRRAVAVSGPGAGLLHPGGQAALGPAMLSRDLERFFCSSQERVPPIQVRLKVDRPPVPPPCARRREASGRGCRPG
jgi:hypothetical protein